MSDLICPFSATLARNDFACPHAAQIIRRGGAEFACQSAAAHTNCNRLFERMKTVSLPEFGVADDPLQVPHGVLAKIQFGGLLGLQRMLADNPGGAVTDIASLVDKANTQFSGIEGIPCEQLVGDITGYQLSRRRRR